MYARSYRRVSSRVFHHSYAPNRHVHSFPTRRSSDLTGWRCASVRIAKQLHVDDSAVEFVEARDAPRADTGFIGAAETSIRSEEHTSELQSHHDLVCRLLLEKKKKPELDVQSKNASRG